MTFIAPRVTAYVFSESRLIFREIQNRRETETEEKLALLLPSKRVKGEGNGTCEWNFLLEKKGVVGRSGVEYRLSQQNVLLEHTPSHSGWSHRVRLCV